MTTKDIIIIAALIFIAICGIVYLFWPIGEDVAKWENQNVNDDNGYRQD